MARMPGAQWRPMPGSSTTPMKSYDILCFHTMVGSLAGTDSYFRSTASGTNSHFGVGGDGTIYQWVDTAFRSGASLNGNYHLISVETADMGAEFGAWSSSNVPAWNDAQIDANARIASWLNETHGIPLVQIPDAKPSRRGVGYHRLGVPGYMVAGAEQWSTAKGKVCPGDRRIAEIPEVISRALRGAKTATPTVSEEDEEMYPYKGYRSDPAQHEDDGRPGDGTMVLAADGEWKRVETPALAQLYIDAEMVKEYKNVRPDSFRAIRDKYLETTPKASA